jgi:hypothetical protein
MNLDGALDVLSGPGPGELRVYDNDNGQGTAQSFVGHALETKP